jgi:hypothetical protein
MDTDNHVAPLGQEDNLNQIADILTEAMDLLPPEQAGMALVAAGLDLLPAGRCASHYRAGLLEVRAEVDRLLAELEEQTH